MLFKVEVSYPSLLQNPIGYAAQVPVTLSGEEEEEQVRALVRGGAMSPTKSPADVRMSTDRHKRGIHFMHSLTILLHSSNQL